MTTKKIPIKNFRQKDTEKTKGKKPYRIRKQIEQEVTKEIKEFNANK